MMPGGLEGDGKVTDQGDITRSPAQPVLGQSQRRVDVAQREGAADRVDTEVLLADVDVVDQFGEVDEALQATSTVGLHSLLYGTRRSTVRYSPRRSPLLTTHRPPERTLPA